MSLFQKLAQALKKTRSIFAGAISAENIEELEQALLQADVGFQSTEHIIEQLKKSKADKHEYKQQLNQILHQILTNQSLKTQASQKPCIIMIVGTPGSGKTTTIAKLSFLFSEQGKKVIISASDTYRAAAATQLGIWAERVGVQIVYSEKGQDAGAVAYDAIQKAISNNSDIVLIDTAGRLHTRKDLMQEAQKIKRVCQKFRTDAPDQIWLILDATVGQNGIQQAKTFNQELNLTGVIITKLDGTAKGGVIIPIVRELNLPIHYLGLGESAQDLEPFDAEKYIQALLE
ncbi:MAG: signal recognition particle-docking protein FtsY [Candidatus Latescibacteria bacterium]|nr:signal recognition particle-docking protein FtsY [Candidatus Latescibacterota bacterium]